MRNLTLGALIVFGGILAALPFRRVPDRERPAAAELSMATGPPANFAVNGEPVTLDQWFTAPASGLEHAVVHSPAGSPTSLASAIRSSDSIRGIPSDALARPRRDLRVPLTYEDLAVPLATPQYTDGRFDALANRQEQQRHAEVQHTVSRHQGAEAIQGRPGFESMAVQVPAQAEQPRQQAPWEMSADLPESILEPPPQQSSLPEASNTGRELDPVASDGNAIAVQGRLASDSQHRRDPSQPTGDDDRPRHWIRQPE